MNPRLEDEDGRLRTRYGDHAKLDPADSANDCDEITEHLPVSLPATDQ